MVKEGVFKYLTREELLELKKQNKVIGPLENKFFSETILWSSKRARKKLKRGIENYAKIKNYNCCELKELLYYPLQRTFVSTCEFYKRI